MIVVKVELHSARTHEVTLLGTMHISNDGTSQDEKVGHYDAHFFGKRGVPLRAVGRAIGFRRKSANLFDLIARSLRNAGYGALLLCLAPSVARAQHIDLGIDAGKAYSIVDGAFVPSTIPSVTLLFGPVEVSTSTYLYGRRFYEQDSKLTWYQREDAKRKWSVYASLGHYGWPGGSSINGEAGLRWRLR